MAYNYAKAGVVGMHKRKTPKEILSIILDKKEISLTEEEKGVVENVKTHPILKLYQQGKWTTDKKVLILLAMEGDQLATDILSYRRAKKYAETIKTFKSEVGATDLIHPKIDFGKTNRANYSKPALMNIPKALTWNIIKPFNEEDILITADIKNQEPLMVANILNIKKLQEMATSQEGLYNAVYKDIFGELPDKHQLKEFKIAWNAMTYNSSKAGVVGICKHTDGAEIYKYFNAFKEFKGYKRLCEALAKKNVQTAITHFGTQLQADKSGKELTGTLMAVKMQGTGSDLLAFMIKRFYEERERLQISERDLYLYYTKHDELIFGASKKYFEQEGQEKIETFIKETLEHQVDDWKPFRLDVKIIET